MQEIFRTQAFGFNKKDVIDYIFEITTQKENLEREAEEQISALSAEKEKLSIENTALIEANRLLEEQLHALKAELADANMQKSRLFEEINENRRLLLDNERELNIKNEQISKLIAENEDYAEKCEKYAEIAKDVGKTIMEAKQMASDIVDKAKNEANEIRIATEKAVNDSMQEIEASKDEIENLKLNLSDLVRVCENRIRTVELNLSSTTDAIRAIAKASSKPMEKAEQPIEAEVAEEKSAHEFF
ncbi:MAG: hypothetical protein E7539_06685 [Ruminococcaceae bacterium]|nr:hypothetical protein [Oscillospiraceae bacterium]